MSQSAKKTKKEDERSLERITKRRRIENDRMTFTYTVVRSLTRKNNHSEWNVIEKGYYKSQDNYEISQDSIMSASRRLRRYILQTPCEKSVRLVNNEFNVYLKKELYQNMDSIKTRGVIYTLLQLSDEQKRKGVITISTGNFGFIVCHYAYKFNIPVTVVIPRIYQHNELSKICREYTSMFPKASVHFDGRNLTDAHYKAVGMARREGLFYLDGNDHPNMIIGQATLGYEIVHQMHFDAVLLPTTTDSCALTMGIATVIRAMSPAVKIIEVQSIVPDIVYQRVRNKTDAIDELNIAVKEYKVCPLTNLTNCVIDRIISINIMLICKAYKYLFKYEGYKDLHAAIAIAALYSGQLDDLKGKSVVIPLYGRMDSNVNLHFLIEAALSPPEERES